MANRKPIYTLTLDKERMMKFDFNALADVEDKLGAGVGEIFSEERMGFSTIRVMFWAGLKWKDKGLTVARTGAILQKCLDEGMELEELADHLSKALIASGYLSEEAVEGDEDVDEEDDESKN